MKASNSLDSIYPPMLLAVATLCACDNSPDTDVVLRTEYQDSEIISRTQPDGSIRVELFDGEGDLAAVAVRDEDGGTIRIGEAESITFEDQKDYDLGTFHDILNWVWDSADEAPLGAE